MTGLGTPAERGFLMAKKDVKPFLLRIDPRVLAAVQRWAEEDLRSLNGQIEYLLRQALVKRGVKLTEEALPEPPEHDDSTGGS